MNKTCAVFASLFFLLFALTGCETAGNKSESLSVVYGIAAVLTLAALVFYLCSPFKKEKWLAVLFSSVLVVNVGYFWLSVSDRESMALMANRLSYLGSVFLPLSVLMVILNVASIKYPKWLGSVLVAVAVLVLALAASPGYCKLYYSDVSFVRANGVSYLKKEYGPLHGLYFVYLLGYFSAMVAAVVHTIVKKKLSVAYHAVILTLAVFINLGVWLIEQFVNLGFELLSVSYVISELFLLSVYAVISEAEKLTQRASQKESIVHIAPVKQVEIKNFTEEQIEAFKRGVEELTPTEKHIYLLYTQNKTTKEIMAELNIKENTLKFHNKNIYSKLGVSSRKQLMEVYIAMKK